MQSEIEVARVRSGGRLRSRTRFADTARPASCSILRITLFYVALLALWQLVYELEIWSPYLFPSPARGLGIS